MFFGGLGHGEIRIPLLLKNVKASLPLCEQVRLVDIFSADDPFLLVAMIISGLEQRPIDQLPPWAPDLIS
jgi:hypothetical protein